MTSPKTSPGTSDENGDKLTWLTKVDRRSRTLGQPAPARAIVLFGGLKTDELANAHLTPDGLLKEGFRTKDAYQDYFLHVEFQNSYMPHRPGAGSVQQRRLPAATVRDSNPRFLCARRFGERMRGRLSLQSARNQHVPSSVGLADV